MMGVNHRLVTGSFVFAFSGSIVATAIACSCASFPDRIEEVLPVSRNEVHRKHSHWFPVYFLPFLLIHWYLTRYNVFLSTDYEWLMLIGMKINATFLMVFFANIGHWFLIACLAHIVEDSICGKIPVLDPNKPKVYFRLFYTGSSFEYIFSVCVSVLVLIAKVPIIAFLVKKFLTEII